MEEDPWHKPAQTPLDELLFSAFLRPRVRAPPPPPPFRHNVLRSRPPPLPPVRSRRTGSVKAIAGECGASAPRKAGGGGVQGGGGGVPAHAAPALPGRTQN